LQHWSKGYDAATRLLGYLCRSDGVPPG